MSHRPAQPAGKRAQVRGGGGDASEGACVGGMHVCPCIMCEIKKDDVRVLTYVTEVTLLCINVRVDYFD